MVWNYVEVLGRLVRDPQEKVTPWGRVSEFRVALTMPGGRKFYIDCAAWHDTLKNVVKYLRKGRLVMVAGHLEYSQWERNGEKRDRHTIKARTIEFMERNAQGGPADDDQHDDGQPAPDPDPEPAPRPPDRPEPDEYAYEDVGGVDEDGRDAYQREQDLPPPKPRPPAEPIGGTVVAAPRPAPPPTPGTPPSTKSVLPPYSTDESPDLARARYDAQQEAARAAIRETYGPFTQRLWTREQREEHAQAVEKWFHDPDAPQPERMAPVTESDEKWLDLLTEPAQIEYLARDAEGRRIEQHSWSRGLNENLMVKIFKNKDKFVEKTPGVYMVNP